MPILIMGVVALAVFLTIGLLLFGATYAEHHQRDRGRRHSPASRRPA